MSEKRFLTRDQFLGATTLPYEDVDVPELGGHVRVRGLTLTEREEIGGIYNARPVGPNRYKGMRARVLATCLTTEGGTALLSLDDIAALGELRADVVERLYEVANRLSGVGEPETIKGNSEPSLNGSSATASR